MARTRSNALRSILALAAVCVAAQCLLAPAFVQAPREQSVVPAALGGAATLLATHDEEHPCTKSGVASLFFTAEANTSYWLVVEGTERNETGKFEVTVLCTNQLNVTIPCNCTEPPACANMTMNLTCPNITCAPCPCETVAPTPAPTVAVFSDDCAYQHLTCLDSITDTNQDAPREIGDESGDMYYLLSAFEPQNLTVTVCARQDSIKMRLALFEDYPTRTNATAILTSGSHVAQCAELELQILEIGAYWLHVEGNGTDEGVFFLDIACANTPVPSFAPTRDLTPCTWDYLTCYDMELGSNFGLSDVVGNPAGDSIYVLTSWMPKKITMTTCTSYTNFKTVLTVWDGWPGDEDSQQLHYEKYRQTDKCAEIVFEVLAGSYWVVLEGAEIGRAHV